MLVLSQQTERYDLKIKQKYRNEKITIYEMLPNVLWFVRCVKVS